MENTWVVVGNATTVGYECTREAVHVAVLFRIFVKVFQLDFVFGSAHSIFLIDDFHALVIRDLHLPCHGNVHLRAGAGEETDASSGRDIFRGLNRNLCTS